MNLRSRWLQKRFESRDIRFLCLYLQYRLLQRHVGITSQFDPLQRHQAESCLELQVAQEIGRRWQHRAFQPVPPDEPLFMALLLSILRVPDPLRDAYQRDGRLRQSIKCLVDHFREPGSVRFYDERELYDQLYAHLAQALNRGLFAIDTDNTLPEEFARLYPYLVCTTRTALAGFENEYSVHFSDEENGLVAVIFGAWLIQENDLHEKQTILLAGNDNKQEAQIERQLHELTLLSLNIRHMSIEAFLQAGIPRGAALIIAPYIMSLPLFSPPLIYTNLTLTAHRQERIRKILKSVWGNNSQTQKYCRKCHRCHYPERAVTQVLIQETGENSHDSNTVAHCDNRVNYL